MTRDQEKTLAELARQAKNLRDTITAADAMLRGWERHKSGAGEISVYLADRRVSNWHASVNLPAEVVQNKLVPVLRSVRDEAAEQLHELPIDT